MTCNNCGTPSKDTKRCRINIGATHTVCLGARSEPWRWKQLGGWKKLCRHFLAMFLSLYCEVLVTAAGASVAPALIVAAVGLSGTLILDGGSVDEVVEQLLSVLSPTYPPTIQRHTLCIHSCSFQGNAEYIAPCPQAW